MPSNVEPFLPANGIILSVLLSASVASYQMVEDACSSHSRSLKAEDSLGKPFLPMFRQTALRTPLAKANTSIQTLYVSGIKRKRGRLEPESIQVGLQRFHKHGLVILENSIGASAIHRVRI